MKLFVSKEILHHFFSVNYIQLNTVCVKLTGFSALERLFMFHCNVKNCQMQLNGDDAHYSRMRFSFLRHIMLAEQVKTDDIFSVVFLIRFAMFFLRKFSERKKSILTFIMNLGRFL